MRFSYEGLCYQYNCLPSVTVCMAPLIFSRCVKSALGVLLRIAFGLYDLTTSWTSSIYPRADPTYITWASIPTGRKALRSQSIRQRRLSGLAPGHYMHDCSYYTGARTERTLKQCVPGQLVAYAMCGSRDSWVYYFQHIKLFHSSYRT